MKPKKYVKTDEKAGGLWQKTKYANLVRNVSSGKYFARFRNNGKLIWRGLDIQIRLMLDTAPSLLKNHPVFLTRENKREQNDALLNGGHMF